MDNFQFYLQLQNFLLKREIPDSATESRKVKRASSNFTIKDDRLFYTGPSGQYMRLVVLSEEQKRAVLEECHNNPGPGNHCGVRGTQNRVIAGYYWSTIIQDVKDWVRSCHRCREKDPIKTVAPVLHSVKVKEAWEVLGLDLIGPLPETARSNKYVFTMTDLYTKWVIAEPMRSQTVAEVSAIVTAKLYLFGMVRKIITDQGEEFVNKLNESIFSTLNIPHAVSGAYPPHTNRQDERTNQNIKRTLRKYVNDNHNDWDLHLPAVVYGINTAKQYSTRHSPYFLLFHRHPHLPQVMNARPMGDDLEVAVSDDDADTRVNEMKRLDETVLSNVERAQSMTQKSFQNRKHRKERQETHGQVSTRDHILGPASLPKVWPLVQGSAVKTEDILQITIMDQLRGRFLGITVTQHSYAREIIHMLLHLPRRNTWVSPVVWRSADGKDLSRRHGQRFVYWTEESSRLLHGTLQLVFRVQNPPNRCG